MSPKQETPKCIPLHFFFLLVDGNFSCGGRKPGSWAVPQARYALGESSSSYPPRPAQVSSGLLNNCIKSLPNHDLLCLGR